MLVNKLLTYVFYQNNEIVKSFDESLQSHPVCQEDDHRYFIFSELVKKIVLKALAFTVRHRHPPLFPFSSWY